MTGDLLAEVVAFGASLRRGKAINVNDQPSKDRAISLATTYFDRVRPALLTGGVGAADLQPHDALWQQLVRLAHGNNSRQTYLKTTSALRKQLAEFNISIMVGPSATDETTRSADRPRPEDKLIIDTLEKLVPSAAASYRQGLTDLFGPERYSYRGTAAEFREALREVLDHLAPDKNVEAQDWYRPEKEQTKPTMRQKVRFILMSRGRNKTQRDTAEKTLTLIDERAGEVMRAIYNRASLATHVQESKTEVQQIKRYVDTALCDLLEIA